MARLSRYHKKKLKAAGNTFLAAFIGSLLTLYGTGKYIIVTTEGAHIPNWELMDELVVSSILAGITALLSYLLVWLQNGNNDVSHET